MSVEQRPELKEHLMQRKQQLKAFTQGRTCDDWRGSKEVSRGTIRKQTRKVAKCELVQTLLGHGKDFGFY